MAGGLALWLVVTSVGRAQPAPAFPEAPADNGVASGVTLGRPVPLSAVPTADSGSRIVDERVARSSFQSPEPLSPITTTVAQSPPQGGIVPVQAPVAPVPGAAEQYNCGVVTQQSPGFWQSVWEGPRRLINCIPGMGGGEFAAPGTRRWFESDHCFDNFISPVTNPFLFEDPRSLTELRPVFIYNATPTGNPVFRGGDIEFFGTQARVAFTDRLSFVVTKFGATWIEPHNADADFQNHVGFSEVFLGPKFTFLRCEDTCTLGAIGLTFEIPSGDRSVLQDTGSLSLVPYLSMGQSFFKTSYGSFNALGTLGYAFRTDSQRSENFFTSLHLDYDVANLHRIYPLMELNWFHYTRNGKDRDLTFEGRDLFNFGSQHVAGHDEVALAFGARVKATEWWTLGLAVEFPLTTQRDLLSYRITADMIFRY
jgi:hypothetical protein